MNVGVVVGGCKGRFDIDGIFNCPQIVSQTIGAAGLTGPFGIFPCCWVLIRKEAD